jgi:hypothetical protein
MQSSSPASPIPSRELPQADIGVFRYSRAARQSIDGSIKGAYAVGLADGGSVGFAAGQVVGHAAGYVEASVTCSAIYGILTFVVLVIALLVKAARR